MEGVQGLRGFFFLKKCWVKTDGQKEDKKWRGKAENEKWEGEKERGILFPPLLGFL